VPEFLRKPRQVIAMGTLVMVVQVAIRSCSVHGLMLLRIRLPPPPNPRQTLHAYAKSKGVVNVSRLGITFHLLQLSKLKVKHKRNHWISFFIVAVCRLELL